VAAIQVTSGLRRRSLAAEYLQQAYRQFCQLFADHYRLKIGWCAISTTTQRHGRLLKRGWRDKRRILTSHNPPLRVLGLLNYSVRRGADWQRVRKRLPLTSKYHSRISIAACVIDRLFCGDYAIEQTARQQKRHRGRDKLPNNQTASEAEQHYRVISDEWDTPKTGGHITLIHRFSTQAERSFAFAACSYHPAIILTRTVGFRVDDKRKSW